MHLEWIKLLDTFLCKLFQVTGWWITTWESARPAVGHHLTFGRTIAETKAWPNMPTGRDVGGAATAAIMGGVPKTPQTM